MTTRIAEVALAVPKRTTFEYLLGDSTPAIGARVQVPFGNRKLVGVVLAIKSDSNWPVEKLKPIQQILDDDAVLDTGLIKLLKWAAQYYQHPIGDVMQSALPVKLRQPNSSEMPQITQWQCSELGRETDAATLSRAPKQQALLLALQQSELTDSDIKQNYTTAIIKALEQKELIEAQLITPQSNLDWHTQLQVNIAPKPSLEQSLAITCISGTQHQFHPVLLEGVTGSGKTEVYLQAIEPVLKQQKQVLILVPEIGLTPQTVSRFRKRFNAPVGLLHSNLTDNERLAVWQQAREGELAIVIGTRSAIFTPFLSLGMIIVDEEHDNSYKQQDGFRYHARDLAVMRARFEQLPLVLGSATPSLESLHNALSAKYQHIELHNRAGNAQHAHQQLFDVKHQPMQFGIAVGMQQRMRAHLEQGNQVMVFINRRGYAPSLLCHDCGEVEMCQRCDKAYTYHKGLNKLQCHHCGDAKPAPQQCSACGSKQLVTQGVGTEQLEQGLSQLFPQYKSVRIDSDNIRSKSRFNQILDDINQRQYQILIGTQILAKGHHFPHVTMVLIVDVDGALFSMDFRAAENLAQLITQVSGRAGRAELAGEMWMQSHQPQHPLLQDLVQNGYQHFARYALDERRAAGLPPFSFQALFRAEAHNQATAHQFLHSVAELIAAQAHVLPLGPFPALMEKRQGRFRMQLLVQSQERGALQKALFVSMPQIEQLPLAAKVRWSLDVDPQDFY
ncbi:primosomal protein N' [Neptunicella marina]|uniref:Replication restart protein PriA n=1 Tax=Neptunicella marina TaxID=2125989 RepID=A0A8J6M210_9ALTE|nr:primosomal protein N' [Neptunicella marina]MBC3765968.1 primosomal protein N' [Neptunicella marina]